MSVEEDKELVVQSLTLPPGGSSGWHTHPGDGFFVVRSGALSTYGLDGPPCHGRPIRAGQAIFTLAHADHPHLRNEGAEVAEFTAVYLISPPGARIAAPAQGPPECRGQS